MTEKPLLEKREDVLRAISRALSACTEYEDSIGFDVGEVLEPLCTAGACAIASIPLFERSDEEVALYEAMTIYAASALERLHG